MPTDMWMVSLDLSKTNTGLVLWDREVPVVASSTSFSGSDGHDEFLIEFDAWLETTVLSVNPTIVAYELARPRHLTHARQYWGMVAIIGLACAKRDIAVMEVHWATAKKVLTGRGTATKEAMLAAATAKWKPLANHDEADAYAVGLAAIEEIRAWEQRSS